MVTIIPRPLGRTGEPGGEWNVERERGETGESSMVLGKLMPEAGAVDALRGFKTRRDPYMYRTV